MNTVIFDNEITLYWDIDWQQSQKPIYKILLDGKLIGETEKTHYSVTGLSPKTDYEITVISSNQSDTFYCEKLTTLKEKNRIDITKPPYNAVGDGVTVNTAALQKALDECTREDVVYFPKGTFFTGALNVHSNTEIFLESGAVLKGTSNISDYCPKIKSRFEGTEMMCYRSLINMGELDRNGGYNCENVVIRGGGEIYGGGKELADNIIDFETERLKDFLEENSEYVSSCENDKTIPGRSRGRLINMSNCKNIILSNLSLGFGPSWNIHMVYSENILTYSCRIESYGVWNGDGWDPDSSENCTVFGTEFCTHDDGIAVKSGKNPEGNIVNRPSKNIKIFDCFGGRGIAIGSEVSGGIDGVFIWDCKFKDLFGIIIKTTDKRGGYIRNIYAKDSIMSAICVATNLYYNNDGESAKTMTVMENFNFENLTVLGEGVGPNGERAIYTPITIEGFQDEENYIKNVIMKNIIFQKPEDNNLENFKTSGVKNFKIENN